jgi:hypothetical protein
VYLYHPHHLHHLYHLYHHDLSKLLEHNLHHDLHHDLLSTLGKSQNNAHKDGRPSHNYHTEHVPAEIHQLKSIHHFCVDNPSEYEHHHMSNKIVPIVDQQMKITVFVHPSF